VFKLDLTEEIVSTELCFTVKAKEYHDEVATHVPSPSCLAHVHDTGSASPMSFIFDESFFVGSAV